MEQVECKQDQNRTKRGKAKVEAHTFDLFSIVNDKNRTINLQISSVFINGLSLLFVIQVRKVGFQNLRVALTGRRNQGTRNF